RSFPTRRSSDLVSTTSRLVMKSSTSWEENPEAAATVAPITNAVEAMIDQSAPRRGWRTRPTRLGVGGVRITRRLLSIGSDGHQRERSRLVMRTPPRSEEHTSELQSRFDLVCRLLLEKKNK